MTVFVVALCLSGGTFVEAGDQPDVSEYQVKAAFLYKFVKFVDWPATAEPLPDGSFGICVLGKDPFGSAFDMIIRTKTALGRRIQVRRFIHVEEVRGCQVLFISASETRKLASVFKALDGTAVLTVGELPEFLATGGMLNLVLAQGRVVFEANPRAAERQGFHLSSKLLQLAVNLRGAPSP